MAVRVQPVAAAVALLEDGSRAVDGKSHDAGLPDFGLTDGGLQVFDLRI